MNLKSPKGIYIHIPFCVQKCSYCDFYSVANPKQTLLMDYITCLCKEITQTSLNYRSDLKSLTSVYIGGGTPNVLPFSLLERLVQHLEDQFGFSFKNLEETTIEINPGLSDFNYLKSLRELGFNRLSIGIQSLNNKLLKLMRRIHNRDEALKTIEESLKAGFNNISCDLIFNYPNQTKEMVLSDLKSLLAFPITHLSAYSLTLAPKTILAKQIDKKKLYLNNDNYERNTYYEINQLLELNGFNHYEISNYAKEGYESKQNNLYWSLGSYFGFGPASSAFLNGVRIDHPADLKSYLEKKTIPKKNIHYLTESELKEEFMFLGLRKLNGLKDQDYKEIFGNSFFIDFKEAIEKCIKLGFIEKNDYSIKLTPPGIDLADRVALEFLF